MKRIITIFGMVSIAVVIIMASCENPTSSSNKVTAIPAAAIIITAPETGSAPSTGASGTGNFITSAVTWEPNHNPFQSGTVYTAKVTLIASTGYTFTGINSATVNGEAAEIANNIGAAITLSRVFPQTTTAPTVISSAAVIVTAPVSGSSPSAVASGTGNFSTGAVTWNPNHDPFQSGKVYTATITLIANSGNTFTGISGGTINGEPASLANNTGTSVTLSYTFPATSSSASASLRYETVPYVINSSARALGENVLDKLIYSGYNENKYYYVFLLGHINLVPVAYRAPIIYDGITPITISYSISNATTESVSQAAQTAIENSTTRTAGVSTSIESQIGFKTGIVNGSLSLNVGANASWGSGSSRSTSNTFETMTASTMQVEDSISATIGNNNQPAGKYRYSLMGTTDVYYVLATTNAKVKTDEYFSVCARGDSFAWGIDYEPELGGNFGKTAGGELLAVPELVLTDLPTPTRQIESDELPPPTPVATPTASPSGSSLTSATSVTLSCSTSGATIYYTMSSTGTPADPTESSTRYTGSIPLAQNLTQTTYTIKARAYHASMPASAVMTKTYTMSATPLKTQFIKDDFSNINWTSYNMDYVWILTDFDKPRLTSEGYTHFIVTIEFNITSVSGSNVTGHVYKGHIHPVNDSGTAVVWINSSNQTTTGLKTATSSRIAIADYNNELTADWMGGPYMGAPSGSSITLGGRKVTVEARKD